MNHLIGKCGTVTLKAHLHTFVGTGEASNPHNSRGGYIGHRRARGRVIAFFGTLMSITDEIATFEVIELYFHRDDVEEGQDTAVPVNAWPLHIFVGDVRGMVEERS